MMALQKRRAVKHVCLSRRPSICLFGHQAVRMQTSLSREQIENMLHPPREVNSTLADSVRPRVFARPGLVDRGPAPARAFAALPFRVPKVDSRLPGRAPLLGALHEIAGGGHGAVDGAVAALFAAGIGSITFGILTMTARQDFFVLSLAS
jgi:hypothetical protein